MVYVVLTLVGMILYNTERELIDLKEKINILEQHINDEKLHYATKEYEEDVLSYGKKLSEQLHVRYEEERERN